MSRATDRWQNERIDLLEQRVMDLEGECSVSQDHRAILHKLVLLADKVDRLNELAQRHDALVRLVLDVLEPEGSVVINVGAISEVN